MKSSKFLKVSCPRCRKIQIIFSKSSIKLKCEGCNKLLAQTTGGKAKVKAQVKKLL
jgi:small subunit ribosomal protein S27e